MKQIYITEKQRNNNFNDNIRRIIISEGQLKRVFSENIEDEGGIVHVNSFDENGVGMSSYEHTKDKNMVIDMSSVGKYMSNSENGRLWIEVPSHLLNKINPQDNYKHINDPYNPPSPTGHDEYVIANGKYYMPAYKNIGEGDNVVISVRKLSVVNPFNRNVEEIKCFNTSMLGNNSTTAILAAHTYKGKQAPIGGKNSQIINATRQDAEYNGRKLKSMPNFINNMNLKKYMCEVRKVILNEKGFGDFNPDFILYPESSSDFNYIIANLLKDFVFKNAQVIPDGGIKKQKGWTLDYPTLIDLYDKRISSNSLNKQRYFNKEFGSNGQKAQDVLLGRTVEYSFADVVSKYIAYKIKPLVNDLYTQYDDGHFEPKVTFEDANTKIFEEFENIFWEEFDKLDNAFEEWNEEQKETRRHYKLNVEFVFLLTARFFYGTYGKLKNSKKNFGGINNIFSSYDEIGRILSTNGAPIFITPNSINSKTVKSDSIKNYGTEERLSVFNQFKIDDNNEILSQALNDNNFKDKRYLVIDDNFASGVSLRNACQTLVSYGIPSQNIIAMTPGDMGESGTGGAIGGKVPLNNGEGSILYDMGNSINPYYSGYEKNKDWVSGGKKLTPSEKYKSLVDKKFANDLSSFKDTSRHGITRSILNNLYFGPQNRKEYGSKNNISNELRNKYIINNENR